jgi:peptide/nickel transport system substrate-binding protein
MAAAPPNIAPIGVSPTATWEITNLVYESLVRWDRNMSVQPALAESWDIPDNKTYIFHLRQGVTFHSGKAFDATDVQYSFGLQKSPPPPGTVTSYYPKIASIDVVDKYTVRFNMASPDATFLGYCAWLAYSPIIPNGIYDRANMQISADGTGPFKVTQYVANSHVALERNRSYWRSGYPYLDSITMKVLADEQARFSALTSGAIDGATFSADIAGAASKSTDLVVLSGTTAAYNEMSFKLGGGKPWDDVRVRQAVNHAVNRQEILDKVFGGKGQYTSKIPPNYGNWPVSQDDLKNKYETYDLDTAKKLMSAAGFASGFKVTLQAIATPTQYVQVSEVIKEQLKKINIDVTVQPLEVGTFAKNYQSGNFEWGSTGRGMRGDPSGFFADLDPAGSLYQHIYKGGYENQKLTDLLAQGLQLTDASQRKQLYDQVQDIVLTEWPTLPLVDAVKYQVVRKRVHDMYVSIDATERGLPEVWVS